MSTERLARSNGQIPLQQPISSASQVPSSSSNVSTFSHRASYQYVEQHRAFVEHQRQLHNEERTLWHIERQELHGKISELEATIRQLKDRRYSELVSPTGIPRTSFSTGGPFANTFSSNQGPGSRTTSTGTSTGDEFWRGAGGKSDAVPTRTFSESSDYSTGRLDERWMPRIAEDQNPESRRSSQAIVSRVTSNESDSHHRPSIDGAQIDKNLDGISFKPHAVPPGVPPSLVKSVTPDSPSPTHSDSQTSPLSPHAPHDPQQDASPSNILTVIDVYTKDAGHTPLARMTSHSNPSSTLETPTALPESITALHEPRPSVSVSRRPNERSDSYFPTPPKPETIVEELDEDPSLKGPLSLPTKESDDKIFLTELDEKLERAARETVGSPEGEGKEKENKRGGEGLGIGEQEEGMPKLRIKRSMNFGSVFGANKCGKGI